MKFARFNQLYLKTDIWENNSEISPKLNNYHLTLEILKSDFTTVSDVFEIIECYKENTKTTLPQLSYFAEKMEILRYDKLEMGYPCNVTNKMVKRIENLLYDATACMKNARYSGNNKVEANLRCVTRCLNLLLNKTDDIGHYEKWVDCIEKL